MLFESHSHTPLCKHATGDPVEYAAVAEERGLSGIHITCHNPMPDGFSANVRMGLEEFDTYVDLVAQATDEFKGRVEVCLGLEADYFEGYEAFLEKQLASADFHFVLGSVHPQIAEWRERYWQGDLVEVQRTYFNLLAKAAETGMFDSISHPDLIKNFTDEVWEINVALDLVRPALDRIAKTGAAMELNTSGMLKRIPEMNPFPKMLREMNQRGIPVTLGADAHVPERVGDGYVVAMGLLKDAGYQHVRYFRSRQPIDVEIDAAIESLAANSANVS
ncbi:histidinol-phosphatase HisJ family protein [Rhodopirellula sp. MGV]|uniref:histidinol-phosphatase HisJ family protein n=1 Tax=Rhodopirellula sp. MGV TaxID=2023130 RepID=UPI000B966E04|nr:histidinol-phosphatase HisJ family protein [Rhodopirellula sp. MGV]OYP35522.1 histidinol-phosphatase [Rhodopirellula sp. MGV]PNY34485.1 PHP domain-containing protein [Rhodopirellula baltica]